MALVCCDMHALVDSTTSGKRSPASGLWVLPQLLQLLLLLVNLLTGLISTLFSSAVVSTGLLVSRFALTGTGSVGLQAAVTHSVVGGMLEAAIACKCCTNEHAQHIAI